MAINVQLFVLGLTQLVISIFSLCVRFNWYKEVKKSGISKIFFLMSFLYFILSILNLLWSFKVLDFNFLEYNSILTIFLIIQSLIFVILFYYLSNNRNIFYLFSFFLLSIPVAFLEFYGFSLFLSFISYIIMLLIFLNFILFSCNCLKRAGYLGMIYSIVSLFFLILQMLNVNIAFLSFLPNILLLFVLFYIFTDINECSFRKRKLRLKNKGILFLYFIRYFVFVITISSFVIISVIGVHEIGHALAATFLGCDYVKAVIYETDKNPYTEVICQSSLNQAFVIISGFLFTLIMGLMIFLISKEFLRLISYLIFGFSFLFAYGDLIELGLSNNLIFITSIIGFLITIVAIFKISLSAIKQTEVISCFNCLIK